MTEKLLKATFNTNIQQQQICADNRARDVDLCQRCGSLSCSLYVFCLCKEQKLWWDCTDVQGSPTLAVCLYSFHMNWLKQTIKNLCDFSFLFLFQQKTQIISWTEFFRFFSSEKDIKIMISVNLWCLLDQLAKLTFRSRYTHTPDSLAYVLCIKENCKIHKLGIISLPEVFAVKVEYYFVNHD